jgi:MFS family permease
MIRAQDFSRGRRFAALAFLLVAYFFYAWSWNTVDILRPYIKASLKLSDFQAGSSYTLQSIGAILGAVIMGQVADKIGRRNALIISMVGYGCGLLSALLVKDYTGLVFQRIGLGFFMGSMRCARRGRRVCFGHIQCRRCNAWFPVICSLQGRI